MDAWSIWNPMGAAAIIFLIIFSAYGKYTVWGFLTVGVVVGLIISLFAGFSWDLYKKVLIISVFAGAFSENITIITKWLIKRSTKH